MTIALAQVVGGLILLILAGDALVRGAVNLALRLGISALVVSLTVVAFGTSAPELLVSIEAVLDDAPGLALGNVVGSNTANVLLVLGVPALISGLATKTHDTRRDYAFMLAGTALFVGFAWTGAIAGWNGAAMLAVLAAILVTTFLLSRGTEPEEVEGADDRMGGWRIAAYLAAGLVGLPVGAHLLVDGASYVAKTYGLSDAVIGLTLVAIGTSLPELATTVMAALRRHADVALGNVIGSNLFNLLAIMGIASLVGPIPTAEVLDLDLWVMVGASLLMIPFVLRWSDINRAWGVALTGAYVAYMALVLS
ncbi:calcium/sodium antiporter [Jannaschia sp. Os4]|uniref:calcium/sodium antiporter n=1 Tax=Jannaschia sp. Os4 TaxID=2807617 RepID=UPI00193AB3CB|nr:calcium/sodium antiporter [Jannaschia sp. Os4]MBM2576155.1 calcium/sodium antiporter [Jannaschia sp. Os4]